MFRFLNVTLVWLPFIICFVLSCGHQEEWGSPNPKDKLLESILTSEHPEVARLDLNGRLCTGTLLRPNVVLTAAHCVDYRTGLGIFGQVIFQAGQRYEVVGALSFSASSGAQDIALLELKSFVPSEVASPASLASRLPASGEIANILGYGCNDRSSMGGGWVGRKQVYRFAVGQTSSHLCPGDSGGPVFVDQQIVWVNSAYRVSDGLDIFAEVARYAESLRSHANQLSLLGTSDYIISLQQRTQVSAAPRETGNFAEDDTCAEYGFYGDHQCDTFCPQPDPDCTSGTDDQAEQSGERSTQVAEMRDNSAPIPSDTCELYGFYGDNQCDTFCPLPDPDCGQSSQDEGNESIFSSTSGETDLCMTYGYYGDGECDTFCTHPDPDCGDHRPTSIGDDPCETYHYYNNGSCDPFCDRPDPDCR